MNATRGRYGNVSAVVAKLQALGVRHIRDVLYVNAPKEYAALDTLSAAGIKADLALGRPDNAGGTPAQLVDLVKNRVHNDVELVEGSNEWDNMNTITTSPWYTTLRAHQTQIYTLMKSDPATKNIPVLMPSTAGRTTGWSLMGDMTKISDYGNLHLYPGGMVPSYYLAKALTKEAAASGTMRNVTTEAGFTDAMNNTTTHRPTPEDVEAIYAPRLLLEHIMAGDLRMYQYELIDQKDDPGLTNREAHFGLLNYDWTPKSQYTAMKNLFDLTSDKGANFTPGKLDYKLTGSTSGVKQLLLQKSDGKFYLVLWRDVSLWDPAKMTRQSVSPVNVGVSLPNATSVSVYRPSVKASAVSTAGSTTSVSLSLGADVQVLQIG